MQTEEHKPAPVMKLPEEKVAAVAFCADRAMEAPLHVAASSLLRNLHPDYQARFYMVLTGFSARDESRIRETLDRAARDRAGRGYELKILAAPDPGLFRAFRPLHGSYIPYHRLMLPEIVTEQRLLYLDSDMEVRTDVSPLFAVDMESKAMGFVVGGVVEFALESRFFLSIGLQKNDPAFNSGAMLIDVSEWKRQRCTERILEFCREHAVDLLAADQTALTVLYGNNCARLEGRYNVVIDPAAKRQNLLESGILHYAGSPKPWDIGATLLLPYARAWRQAARETAVGPRRRIPWLNAGSWKRFPKILGGYWRAWRR